LFGVENKFQLHEIKEFCNQNNIVEYIKTFKNLVSSKIKIKCVFNNIILLKLKTTQVLTEKKKNLNLSRLISPHKETCTSSKSY
jgi:hypothetical protein